MRSRRSRRSRGRGAGTEAGPALVMMSGSLELLTKPTARKECLAATEVWSSDATYHRTLARGRYADIPAEFPQCLFHQVLRHRLLAVFPRRRVASSWPSSRAYHCARMRVEMRVSSPEPICTRPYRDRRQPWLSGVLRDETRPDSGGAVVHVVLGLLPRSRSWGQGRGRARCPWCPSRWPGRGGTGPAAGVAGLGEGAGRPAAGTPAGA